jgi:hypothetical protein
MKRLLGSLTLGCLAGVLLAIVPAVPGHASWVSDHCNTSQSADYHVRRLDAQAYALVAFGEGYEWGGGCWNDNNQDDTPRQPDSAGEGPDCSGLVFKTWELQNNGNNAFTYHDKLQNDHGPYTSYDFHSPADDPFFLLPDKSRTTTRYMDAFAKRGHVALLWSDPPPSSGLDYVGEALGDAYGTDEFAEDYRYDSAYVAIRRVNWTADCYPHCQLPTVLPAIVP